MQHFSHKTKRILLWIPVVNLILFFTQYLRLRNAGKSEKVRAIIICFATFGASAILQLFVAMLFPPMQPFSGMIIAYVAPVVLNLLLMPLQPNTHGDITFCKTTDARKKWLAVTIGCVLVVVLICLAVFQNSAMHIADQNGEDDTSLSVITKTQIIEGMDCTLSAHTQTATGNSSQIGGRHNDVDRDTVSHTFGKISGVYTVHATKTEAQTLTLTVTSVLQSGNMELAIIVDNKYYCGVPVNQTEQITLENISGKTVLVQLGGESAKAEVFVSRK